MNTDITKQLEMVLYRTEDDNVTVSALIKDETIWLTQKAMAELFGIDKSGISRHLAKIFETGELDEEVVVAQRLNFKIIVERCEPVKLSIAPVAHDGVEDFTRLARRADYKPLAVFHYFALRHSRLFVKIVYIGL